MILDADWTIISEEELQRKIYNREICIFGDSERNSLIYDLVSKGKIKCIIDNDEQKWGEISNCIPIVKPKYYEHCVLLSAVADCTSLMKQLMELGYDQWCFFIDDEVYERRFRKVASFIRESSSEFVWKERHYKYIHIMPDQKFIYPLSVVLEHSFNVEEHAFLMYGFNESNPQDIYSMWDLYRRLSREYENIALVGDLYSFDRLNKKRLKVIEEKLVNCEKIIFHGEWINDWIFNFFKRRINLLEKKGCLIAWSGNFGNDTVNEKYISCLLKYCRLVLCRVNSEVLEKIKCKVGFPIYTQFLTDGPSYSVPSVRLKKRKNVRPKVFIAHSCFPYNRVIESLDLLKIYGGLIDIYCCGSYGDIEYIDQVKKHGRNLYGENFHFVEQYMQYNEYFRFINDMDVVFFAEVLPAGATTIRMLAYAGKKIYLSKSAAKKFECEGIKSYDINSINKCGIKDFLKNDSENENFCAVKKYFDFNNAAYLWDSLFSYSF